MKYYKSLISALLALILMLSAFTIISINAYAKDSSPTFSVGNITAECGAENVAVNVSVKNNPGVASIALNIFYNETALTLTGFDYNTVVLNGASTVPFNSSAKPYCLSVINGTNNIVTSDFVLATLYFDISNNATGNYEISLSYDEDNVYNIDEKNVKFEVVNGIINVKEAVTTVPVETEKPETTTLPTGTLEIQQKDISNWKVEGIKDKTYTGKVLKQSNIIVSNGNEYADFLVLYKNNLNVGTADITIIGAGFYKGTIYKTFNIKKAANPITVKISNKTLKYSNLKKNKAIFKVITIKKNKGNVFYKKISGNQKITISSKTGKIAVKKGLKKGNYKLKVKITAKGNSNYKSKRITKTINIRVK